MHYAQWPWKAGAKEVVASGALLGENPALSEVLFGLHPWQVFTVRSLAGGWVPLWNPYSHAGAPFVGNARSAVFYPLNWPAWLVPSMRVFTVAILLKIVLAGLFMALFLSGSGLSAHACALGAVSFALCSFITSWLLYPHTNGAIVLPLLMHAARALARQPGAGPFLLLAFAGGAQYLGGHPGTSLHVMGLSTIWFLVLLPGSPRPRLAFWLFALSGAAGFLLSAIQVLPLLDYLSQSAALPGHSGGAGLDPDLPAGAWLTLLMPGRYGWPWNHSYHAPDAWQATVGYAGAGGLLLAAASFALTRRGGRDVRFLQVAGLLSAVAVYGPVNSNRLLLVLCFCIAALSAYGLDRVRSTAGLLAPMTVLAGVALWSGQSQAGGGRLAATLVCGTGILAALAAARPSRRSIYLTGIVALACADLVIFAWRYNPHADPAVLFPRTGLIDFLRRDAGADMVRGGRILTVGWTMLPDTHVTQQIAAIDGFDAMEFARYRRLLDRSGAPQVKQSGDAASASRPLLNLMGTRYFVTPPEGVVSGEDLHLAYDGPDGRVFVNGQAAPRLAFVDRAVAGPAGGDEAILARLASAAFDPKAEVMLEGAEAGPATAPAGAAAGPAPGITLERNVPNEVIATLSGHGREGYLVLHDAWDRGWAVTIDGRPAPLLRANYFYRAVRVPSTDCTVSFRYQPLSFRIGLWISALTLLGLVGIGLVLRGQAARREAAH